MITPELLNRWRIWPRLIITLYGLAFYRTTEWFMALEEPTNAQSAFVSVIIGAGAGFFGIYVNGRTSDSSISVSSTDNSNYTSMSNK